MYIKHVGVEEHGPFSSMCIVVKKKSSVAVNVVSRYIRQEG